MWRPLRNPASGRERRLLVEVSRYCQMHLSPISRLVRTYLLDAFSGILHWRAGRVQQALDDFHRGIHVQAMLAPERRMKSVLYRVRNLCRTVLRDIPAASAATPTPLRPLPGGAVPVPPLTQVQLTLLASIESQASALLVRTDRLMDDFDVAGAMPAMGSTRAAATLQAASALAQHPVALPAASSSVRVRLGAGAAGRAGAVSRPSKHANRGGAVSDNDDDDMVAADPAAPGRRRSGRSAAQATAAPAAAGVGGILAAMGDVGMGGMIGGGRARPMAASFDDAASAGGPGVGAPSAFLPGLPMADDDPLMLFAGLQGLGEGSVDGGGDDAMSVWSDLPHAFAVAHPLNAYLSEAGWASMEPFMAQLGSPPAVNASATTPAVAAVTDPGAGASTAWAAGGEGGDAGANDSAPAPAASTSTGS